MSAPSVSVVTPVFNGAEFLGECIDSVLRQTHANWSMVIVDNASTDATPEIAARYATRDARVHHVRHEEFHVEVNDSINRALATTDPESDWCKVVLADDWLAPECLEQMLAIGHEHPRVAIVSAQQRWGERVHLTHLSSDEVVVSGRTVLERTFLRDQNVTGNPTALMIRTPVVLGRQPFYDRRLNHADTDAAYRTLVDHDLAFVHRVLTFARRQGGTTFDESDRIGSTIAENLLSVVRYGPSVLDAATLETALRRHVRSYGRYLAKQAVRPSRHRDAAFLDYHRAALTWLREAAPPGHRGLDALLRLGRVALFGNTRG